MVEDNMRSRRDVSARCTIFHVLKEGTKMGREGPDDQCCAGDLLAVDVVAVLVDVVDVVDCFVSLFAMGIPRSTRRQIALPWHLIPKAKMRLAKERTAVALARMAAVKCTVQDVRGLNEEVANCFLKEWTVWKACFPLRSAGELVVYRLVFSRKSFHLLYPSTGVLVGS